MARHGQPGRPRRDVILGRRIRPVGRPRPPLDGRPVGEPPGAEHVPGPQGHLPPRQVAQPFPEHQAVGLADPPRDDRERRRPGGGPAVRAAPWRAASRRSDPGRRPCRRPGRSSTAAPSPARSRHVRGAHRHVLMELDDPPEHDHQADAHARDDPPRRLSRRVLAREVLAAVRTALGVVVDRAQAVRAGHRVAVIVAVALVVVEVVRSRRGRTRRPYRASAALPPAPDQPRAGGRDVSTAGGLSRPGRHSEVVGSAGTVSSRPWRPGVSGWGGPPCPPSVAVVGRTRRPAPPGSRPPAGWGSFLHPPPLRGRAGWGVRGRGQPEEPPTLTLPHKGGGEDRPASPLEENDPSRRTISPQITMVGVRLRRDVAHRPNQRRDIPDAAFREAATGQP